MIQTPLIELLERIPQDARLIVEHDQFSSSSHPVGRMCHEAAAALRAALAEPVQEPATMPGPGLVMCPACCSQFEPAGAQSRRAGAGACAEISVNRVIAAIEEWKSLWLKVPTFASKVNRATREAITVSHNPLFALLLDAQAAKRMPNGCTTPSGCQQHGCHGECLPAPPKRPAEPEQEPVGWLQPRTLDGYLRPDLGYETCSKSDYGAFPVYTAPPQRKENT